METITAQTQVIITDKYWKIQIWIRTIEVVPQMDRTASLIKLTQYLGFMDHPQIIISKFRMMLQTTVIILLWKSLIRMYHTPRDKKWCKRIQILHLWINSMEQKLRALISINNRLSHGETINHTIMCSNRIKTLKICYSNSKKRNKE